MSLREVEQQRVALEVFVGLLELDDRVLVLAEVVQRDALSGVRIRIRARVGVRGLDQRADRYRREGPE